MTDSYKTRGLLDKDDIAFNPFWVERMKAAQAELQFLLNRNYPMQSAVTFVCNHHQLSARQALALTRSTAASQNIQLRKSKELQADMLKGQTVYIDGFNLIITLEVALCDGMLFMGQDGCIRDLAQLRGSYKIIPQTKKAIEIILDELVSLQASNVVIMLDEPVSNSGKLKTLIYETEPKIPVEVQIVRNPDVLLKKLPCIISCDANVLDEGEHWFNMAAHLFKHKNIFQNLTRLIQLTVNHS